MDPSAAQLLPAFDPAPQLRALAPDERAAYFRGIQPLWGGGLEVEQFVAYQRRLADASESVNRYELLGLIDQGQMVSAMKTYRFEGLNEGAKLAFRGVGAVFTPPELRRRGYAAHMMRLALERFAAEGTDAALLFSDIGTRYYERLGFRVIESAECKIELGRLPRGKSARAAAPGDEERMARALARHRENAAGVTLARDSWVLRFQLRRLRELARARSVGEPDWGLIVDGPGTFANPGEALGAAMIRYTKDGIDILDAAWDTGAAREAILCAIRERLGRIHRDVLRVWPSHQLRALFPATPRTSGIAMIASLSKRAESIAAGTRSELALLDHI